MTDRKIHFQRKIHSWVCVCFALVCIAGRTPAFASRVEDLNLAVKQKHWTTTVKQIENPHDLPCLECHEGDSPGSIDGEQLVYPDTVALCISCHGDSSIHPVDVSPAQLGQTGAEMWLPLGKGDHEGKIVCLTCHYIHSDRYYRSILRGDDLRYGHRRETLCSTCHGYELIDKSPHRRSAGSCTFCHTKVPKAGDTHENILKSDIQGRCNFCHDTLADGHFLSVNPFSDPELADKDIDITLIEGRFTCISCHDPHAREDGQKKMLRPDYLELAALSKRINPHWKEVMCISCHTGEPERGKPSLKFSGDTNILCNRCHDGIIARNDVHPVGKVPTENVIIPEDMPLHGGILSCATCHDSSLQEGAEKRTSVRRRNPAFLRDGFVTRNEYCLRCHQPPERYARLDAHQQVSESGSIKTQKCLFCHSSLPDVKVLGIEPVSFDTESLDDYCTVCHRDARFTQNHPVGEHLVEPSRDIYRAIETATERIGVRLPLYNDMITCATCHNPHQKGVIQTELAEMGGKMDAEGYKRLRLGKGLSQCVGCHTGKSSF